MKRKQHSKSKYAVLHFVPCSVTDSRQKTGSNLSDLGAALEPSAVSSHYPLYAGLFLHSLYGEMNCVSVLIA